MHARVQIAGAGDFGVRVHNAKSRQARIVLVSVALQGACTLVSICRLTNEPPPYRIDNRWVPPPAASLSFWSVIYHACVEKHL
jgi:hypothetical protein